MGFKRDHVMQRAQAPRDINGNSRGGLIVSEIHDYGFVVAYYPAQGSGDRQPRLDALEAYPDAVMLDYEIKISASEHNRLRAEHAYKKAS